MSEEKTDKQLLLAEHKKANDALRIIKSNTRYIDSLSGVTHDECENFYLYKHKESFHDLLNSISIILKKYFDIVMKSNDKKTQSTFKPIKVKNLPKEIPMKTKKPVKTTKKKVAKKATTTKRK